MPMPMYRSVDICHKRMLRFFNNDMQLASRSRFFFAVRCFPLIGVTRKIALGILNTLRDDQKIVISRFESGKTSASQELSHQQFPESRGLAFQNADFGKASCLCSLAA
jgi:hypothetical protein